MRFRPCIDIHNGMVKQIVGSSLSDEGDSAAENYVSGMSASSYAEMFKRDGLYGGHVIMLNHSGSEHFENTRREALQALSAFPGGLQIGGGINAENASSYLSSGASHVIVTSYAFKGGEILYKNIERLISEVGRDKIVLDLSCKRAGSNESFVIMTDRWQKATDICVTNTLLDELSKYCDEFLIHAVSSEGKMEGPDTHLIRILSSSPIPVTYAGGISSQKDMEKVREYGKGRVDFTVGSALDIYGGTLPYSLAAKYRL